MDESGRIGEKRSWVVGREEDNYGVLQTYSGEDLGVGREDRGGCNIAVIFF